MSGRISRFALVGLFATLVHMVIGMVLIAEGVTPLLANLLAFLMAFCVSFTGHHLLTFSGHGNSPAQAFWRFTVTAMTGFIHNEAIFSALMSIAHMPISISLMVSIGSVSALTYIISKNWVFKQRSIA